MKRIAKIKEMIRSRIALLVRDESGSEYASMAILVIIAIVVGGTIIGFVNGMIPDLGNLFVNKIKSLFTL